jgi:hypothetical protein
VAGPRLDRVIGRSGRGGLPAALAGMAIAFPMLVLSSWIIRYDGCSYARHAGLIRRFVPWRSAILIVPPLALLPLTGLLLPATSLTLTLSGVGNLLLQVGWLLACACAAEVYSVALHREAWVPEYEPESLPADARPLGWRSVRRDDVRVQWLSRSLLAFTVPLAITFLFLSWNDRPVVLLSAGLFLAKLFAFSSALSEFEAVVHWQMHVRVLAQRRRPHWSRSWEGVVDWALGPLNGYVPRVYNANHLLIHHPENSGPDDIHSPLPYRRTSFLEFGAFAWRMIWSLLFGADLAFHRRCRGRSRRMVLRGVIAFWMVVAVLISTERLLAVWLVVAALNHAVTTARSQYVWHGLVDLAEPGLPLTSTILWVPERKWWDERLATRPTVVPARRSIDLDVDAWAAVPGPGTNWAFYDNLHLVHHLHPRAHYGRYPELLNAAVPDILSSRTPVLELSGLSSFVIDCWARRFDRVAAILLTDTGEEDPVDYLLARLEPLESCRAPIGTFASSRRGQRLDRALTAALLVATRSR